MHLDNLLLIKQVNRLEYGKKPIVNRIWMNQKWIGINQVNAIKLMLSS